MRRPRLTFAALTAGLLLSLSGPAFAAADDRNVFTEKPVHVDSQTWGMWAAEQYPEDAEALRVINETPQARWIGEWTPASTIRQTVGSYLDESEKAGALPLLVTYAVPFRDCGSYSAGGFNSPANYREWVDVVAATVGSTTAAIIVEPDALTAADCLDPATREMRFDLLRYAVTTFAALPDTSVYIDAGHSRWKSVADITALLKRVGVDEARGFSLNVSNFYTTAEQEEYAEKVAVALGGKHYVIDTSRNGFGPADETPENWCNPAGRTLGLKPTAVTNGKHADAYLWVKHPGESDGTCKNSPVSGLWHHVWAMDVIARSLQHGTLTPAPKARPLPVATPAPAATTPPKVTVPLVKALLEKAAAVKKAEAKKAAAAKKKAEAKKAAKKKAAAAKAAKKRAAAKKKKALKAMLRANRR